MLTCATSVVARPAWTSLWTALWVHRYYRDTQGGTAWLLGNVEATGTWVGSPLVTGYHKTQCVIRWLLGSVGMLEAKTAWPHRSLGSVEIHRK